MVFESPCPHQGAAQGALISEKPPTENVERFLFMLRLRFKIKGEYFGRYADLEISKAHN
jgi:hypothetical protein